MLIISQDQKSIINFDKVSNTWVENEENEINIYSDGELLGTYKSEKRVEEILKEIITTYSDFNYYKHTIKETKYDAVNLLKLKYEHFDIYEMPEE